MDFSKLIDYLKLQPKYFLIISLVTGYMLFGNDDILIKMGILPFIDDFRSWIGVLFLVSASSYLVHIIIQITQYIKKKYKRFASSKFRIKRLHQLTPGEKAILSYYINHNTRTQYLDISDGTVNELEKLQIIYRSSSVSRSGTFFSYNIQPWAFDYLMQNKHLLNGAEEEQPFIF